MGNSGLEIAHVRTAREYVQPVTYEGNAGGTIFDKDVTSENERSESNEQQKIRSGFLENLGVPGVREKARAIFAEKFRNAVGGMAWSRARIACMLSLVGSLKQPE